MIDTSVYLCLSMHRYASEQDIRPLHNTVASLGIMSGVTRTMPLSNKQTANKRAGESENEVGPTIHGFGDKSG